MECNPETVVIFPILVDSGFHPRLALYATRAARCGHQRVEHVHLPNPIEVSHVARRQCIPLFKAGSGDKCIPERHFLLLAQMNRYFMAGGGQVNYVQATQ